MNRRNFIKLSGLTAASLTPLARVGTGLALGSQWAISAPVGGGYKALVVVFLDGGNDAMNMFPPTGTTEHAQYNAIRSIGGMNIAITNLDDSTATSPTFTTDTNGYYVKNNSTNHPYYDAPQGGDSKADSAHRSYFKGSYHTTGNTPSIGINSMMPELASMYKSGKVSLVSNVGTLVRPTTQAQISSGSAELPVFLFAHNHQKRAVYTAQAEKLGTVGWAGKIADDWGVNAPVGLNITYSDINRMMIGTSTSALKMPTSNPISFETAYNEPRERGDIWESLLNRFNGVSNSNAFSSYYAGKMKKAGELSTLLVTGMNSAPDFSTFTAKNTYGDSLFSFERSGVGDYMKDIVELEIHDELREGIFQQFEATAKMIKVGKDELNHTRHIFYIRMPGYDSHSGQASNHLNNLRALSMAVSDFQKAIDEMGMGEEVLTVSLSDFGRTLKNNSDGTDHGWGGHSFIMSSATAFQGGNILGTVMDDLRLNGVNTYTEKGRIIPTTSIEQMLAPCLKWFGVDDALMATALPNLTNFRANSTPESAFLQGVFSTT